MNLGQEQESGQMRSSSETRGGQEEQREARSAQGQREDELEKLRRELKRFEEDLRRALHCLSPLRLLLLKLREEKRVEVNLRMTNMAEVKKLAKKMCIECHSKDKCLPDILDAYDLYPDVNEMLYMGLVSFFAVSGCSQTVYYLVENRRESIRPMITILRFLVAHRVIKVRVVVAKLVRAEPKCFEEKKPPSPEEEKVCLVMEITVGELWGYFCELAFEKDA